MKKPVTPKEPEIKKSEALETTPLVKPTRPAIFGFFQRYWSLLILFVLGLALAISPMPFLWIGTLAYIVVLPTGAMLIALLIRNQFNSETSDRDAATGIFQKEWSELDPSTRTILAILQLLTYFIGSALIAASLIR